jgi:WD40 repeat protein
VADCGGVVPADGRLLRGHRLSVTAVALTSDERTVFSVSKDGAILQHDVESGQRQRFASAEAGQGRVEQAGTQADWVRRGPRTSGSAALLAAAVSSDGRYLAVGGGDRKVHVWDARGRQYIKVRGGTRPALRSSVRPHVAGWQRSGVPQAPGTRHRPPRRCAPPHPTPSTPRTSHCFPYPSQTHAHAQHCSWLEQQRQGSNSSFTPCPAARPPPPPPRRASRGTRTR